MEKLDRGTIKIKICQLKVNSKHMLHAGDNKEYDSSVVLEKKRNKRKKIHQYIKKVKDLFFGG